MKTPNSARGPFKAILATRQGDLIDYTHSRSFESARNWLGAIGPNAVGLILDREGFPVWESHKLDEAGNVIKANPDSIHIDIHSHNTKGRNVRAKNPVTEARELFLFAQNNWDTYQKVKRILSGDETMTWQKAAEHAARDYSAEFGSGSTKWREIFTTDDVRVVASMLRSHYEELEGDDIPETNPTPRLKRYDQPSQRERINPRTGRPTKAPSKRLKNRRLMTHYFAPEGVWANPLTRVKLKSPAQRPAGQGDVPEKGSRLYKRRQTTQKAPPGFYANPIPKMPDPIRIDENALITPHYIGPGIYEMMPHVSDTGFPTQAKADKYAAKIADVFKKEFGFSQIVYVVKGPTSAARGKFVVTTSPGPYSIVSMWRGK